MSGSTPNQHPLERVGSLAAATEVAHFTIPRDLYTDSHTLAKESSELLPAYSATAVRLLGRAAEHGFNSETTLLAGDAEIILPPLATRPDRRKATRQLVFTTLAADLRALELLAEDAGITPDEHVCRALRLQNFVTRHKAAFMNMARFAHEGQRVTLIY